MNELKTRIAEVEKKISEMKDSGGDYTALTEELRALKEQKAIIDQM